MALPFSIVQGLIQIMDSAGNLVETVLTAGKRRLTAQSTLVGGNAPHLECDVIQIDGVNRIRTDSIVQVEQIFGQDNYADNWFFINAAGVVGSTIRIQIAGYTDPTGIERSIPAVDKTVTLTSNEAGKEIALRDYIITQLGADPAFSAHWRASTIKDNAIVHISSKYIGEYGQRLLPESFIVTGSNGNIVVRHDDVIKKRGKANSGSRDPRDKRLVTVGISGEVVSVPGAVGDIFIKHALNGTSDDMRVNGSLASPVVFSITPDAVYDLFIKEMRFFGNANGIKFGSFLNKAALVNGVLVEIKSDDKITLFDPIKLTDDFKHEWAFGIGSGFELHIQSGRDDFLAAFALDSAFPLRKSGTFATDDYIKVYIRDDLSSGLLSFQFLSFGFKREP